MPSMLSNHFREIEIRIVSEYAWQNDSPVVQIVKNLVEKQKNQQVTNEVMDELEECYVL